VNSSAIHHYSRFKLLPDMLNVGAVTPSTAEGAIPPAVWCSAAPVWEPIARAAVDLDIPSETALRHSYFGEYESDRPMRICIRSEVVREWDTALLDRGTDPTWIFHLAQTGYEGGSDPENWFVSSTPICVRDWLCIDVWIDRWHRLCDVNPEGELVYRSGSRRYRADNGEAHLVRGKLDCSGGTQSRSRTAGTPLKVTANDKGIRTIVVREAGTKTPVEAG